MFKFTSCLNKKKYAVLPLSFLNESALLNPVQGWHSRLQLSVFYPNVLTICFVPPAFHMVSLTNASSSLLLVCRREENEGTSSNLFFSLLRLIPKIQHYFIFVFPFVSFSSKSTPFKNSFSLFFPLLIFPPSLLCQFFFYRLIKPKGD